MAKNQEKEVIAEEVEAGEARVYELGFHLDPELPIEGVKAAFQAIRTTITAKGAIIAEVEPEKIQLAYTISRQEVAGRRDFDSAYFAWIVYEMTAADHAEVISVAGANKAIVRFIDLLTSKDQARHSLEIHELLIKAPEPVETDEEVLNTELDAALESAAA